MTCPPGYHPRRAYTLKRTGTRVAASCVRATTKAGPRSAFIARARRLQGHPLKERGVTSCPSGQVVRDAYVRVRRGTRTFVPASCIKDGPGIGPLRKGDLKQFGYDNVVSVSDGLRHIALARAVKAYGSLTVWRKLNAIYVYTRNTVPASSAVFKADRDWVKEKYGLRAF